MNTFKLKELIDKVASAAYESENFITRVLVAKASQAAEAYPYDQTSAQMKSVLEKKADENPFISRSEFRKLYTTLYVHNNKFAKFFEKELGGTNALAPVIAKKDDSEGKDFMSNAYKLADPLLVNAFEAAFDDKKQYKLYSNAAAKKAEEMCYLGLSNNSLPPKTVEAISGRSDIILCKATYETPKGQSNVIVPVEIKENRALLPNMFLSTAGFVDVGRDAIKNHIYNTAGKSFNVDVESVMNVLSATKNGMPKPANEIDLAIMRVRASKGTQSYDPNGIIYQEVDDKPEEDVSTNQLINTKDVEKMTERLGSVAGAAEFILGKKAVNAGREMISYSMKNWGFDGARVVVADNNKDTVFFAVSLQGKAAFTVPVKISSGKASPPQVMATSFGVVDFNQDAVQNILSHNSPDMDIMAIASPMYNQKPSDIIEEIRTAMLDDNYIKAEEGLSVLQKMGNRTAYTTAFQIYKAGLSGALQNKEASKCTLQIKVANSIHKVCGHTNLPLHKVYQDKNGVCHPGYRQHMSENYDGASFLHSRVYFE